MLAKPTSGQTLHGAIEAYKIETGQKHVDAQGRTSSWGGVKTRQIEFARSSLDDLDLTQVGQASIEKFLEILARCPPKKNGEYCSESFARRCLKEFRVFLEWLDSSDDFFWVWPAGFKFKKPKIQRPKNDEDYLASPRQLVKRNTVPELVTLYEFARPIQRLYMLLGLNCSFINSEMATLQTNEIFEDQPHPNWEDLDLPEDRVGSWISTLRSKTSAFGTWLLWPQTVEGINWWLIERKRIQDKVCKEEKIELQAFERTRAKGKLLITQTGIPVWEQDRRTGRIPNSWNSLLRRVKEEHPDFNSLSVKHLRKSGTSLIRRAEKGGDEIASIYLAHGKPYKDDTLLEVYAARPLQQSLRCTRGGS